MSLTMRGQKYNLLSSSDGLIAGILCNDEIFFNLLCVKGVKGMGLFYPFNLQMKFNNCAAEF